MAQVYLFCLVLGGGLAALSVLGDALDMGADVEVDADAVDAADVDGLSEVDADAVADLEAGADAVDAGAEGAGAAAEAVAAGGDAADADADAEKVFSLRGLIYALFGFGLAGTVFGWLGHPATAPTTLVFSGAAGAGSGWVTTKLVNWLRGTETGGRRGQGSFEGRPGRVVLPLAPGSPGRVKVRRGERQYELRALPYDPEADGADGWDEVVVVEMRDGVAYVSPLEDVEDLRLSS